MTCPPGESKARSVMLSDRGVDRPLAESGPSAYPADSKPAKPAPTAAPNSSPSSCQR